MCAVKWKIKWKLIQTFCPKSLQEMNRGVTGTTRRQNNKQIASSPRPKKVRQVKSNAKIMLICFFDIKGLIQFEFVPQGQTANKQFYLEVLKRLSDAVRRKRLEFWRSGEWLLQHDNASAHTALSVRHFLAKNGMTMASRTHPPPPPPPNNPQIWQPAISSCFQEWRGALK